MFNNWIDIRYYLKFQPGQDLFSNNCNFNVNVIPGHDIQSHTEHDVMMAVRECVMMAVRE